MSGGWIAAARARSGLAWAGRCLVVGVVGLAAACAESPPAVGSSPNREQAWLEPEPPPLSEAERAEYLEAFDYIVKTVRERHWDPDLGGVDWDGAARELRPRVEEARSPRDFYAAVDELIGRLGLTHYGLIPARAMAQMGGEAAGIAAGQPGFDLRLVDGRILITDIQEGTPAEEAGVRPGWQLLELDGRPVAELILELDEAFEGSSLAPLLTTRALLDKLGHEAGEETTATFLGPGDAPQTVAFRAVPPRGTLTRFGNFSEHVWFEASTLDGGIGYFRFNVFLGSALMEAFGTFVEEHREAPGLIIDLRGNPGGIGLFAMGMAGWLFEYQDGEDQGRKLGTMKLRGTELGFVIYGRLDAYRGPVAVLIDENSASTSEILAAGLRDLGRARLFGRRTAGAALPSVIEKLGTGDGFQYAVADYVSVDGQRLEGAGVTPDVEVKPAREELLRGRDPVVEAARAWILETVSEAGGSPGQG